jgi:pimeloyl-ACP methyl ester carboxylesterase
VLLHGYLSSFEGNWQQTGWIDFLVGQGRSVVALDCRGHGRSGKPHDPAAYEDPLMLDNVLAVMDAAARERRSDGLFDGRRDGRDCAGTAGPHANVGEPLRQRRHAEPVWQRFLGGDCRVDRDTRDPRFTLGMCVHVVLAESRPS